jgi:hypothetical protein
MVQGTSTLTLTEDARSTTSRCRGGHPRSLRRSPTVRTWGGNCTFGARVTGTASPRPPRRKRTSPMFFGLKYVIALCRSRPGLRRARKRPPGRIQWGGPSESPPARPAAACASTPVAPVLLPAQMILGPTRARFKAADAFCQAANRRQTPPTPPYRAVSQSCCAATCRE